MVTRIFCRYRWKNEKVIREYIRNQLQEDYISDQISMEEYVDPFTEKEVGKK